jgi:site-specific DNA recombinase
MSPSFSMKKGVRYRFYVSSALLRGRKDKAGSVTRVSAAAIEDVIIQALRAEPPKSEVEDIDLLSRLSSARLGKGEIVLAVQEPDITAQNGEGRSPITEIRIAWNSREGAIAVSQPVPGSGEFDQKLIQALIRARCWAAALVNNDFVSVEQLAATVKLHPKVVRQNLRLAFLSPDITSAILEGRQPSGLSLTKIPKLLPLPWTEHQRLLG